MSYISDKSFLIEVAKGNVAKHSIVDKFGENSSIGTSYVPVASGGTYQTPTALTSVEIVSDSANDVNTSGSGAHQVEVTGLSTGWAEITETVNLNGTTAVALSNQFFRIYRARVSTSGTYGSPAGASHNSTITINTSGAGALWAEIDTDGGFGLGSSEIGVYSVPTGHTAYLLESLIDVDSTKSTNVLLFKREGADDVASPFSPMIVLSIHRGLTGEQPLRGPAPVVGKITGPADIGYMAKVASGASVKCEVTMQILLIED